MSPGFPLKSSVAKETFGPRGEDDLCRYLLHELNRLQVDCFAASGRLGSLK